MKRFMKILVIAICCILSCNIVANADNDKPISVNALPAKAQTGAPDKPCGGGHTDANSKTVAIRYMIENKLVPLHYES